MVGHRGRVDAAGHQLPYIDRVIVNVAEASLIPAKTGAGESDLQARTLRFDNISFLKSGEIKSRGEYNIGEAQQGLTYWTTTPDTAVYYANAFQPWAYKPTFEHPAWVVATKRPSETRDVPGTGENEVGVVRPIRKDEIIGTWRGDVSAFREGKMQLRRPDLVYEGNDYVVGSSSAPSSDVLWFRADEEKKKRWQAIRAEALSSLARLRRDCSNKWSGPWDRRR